MTNEERKKMSDVKRAHKTYSPTKMNEVVRKIHNVLGAENAEDFRRSAPNQCININYCTRFDPNANEFSSNSVLIPLQQTLAVND
uniref:Uncharacterized protein n=1 Tax=Romanomermis culicivorax TaxID=13658 RepID=A0A915JIV2_ROMCU